MQSRPCVEVLIRGKRCNTWNCTLCKVGVCPTEWPDTHDARTSLIDTGSIMRVYYQKVKSAIDNPDEESVRSAEEEEDEQDQQDPEEEEDEEEEDDTPPAIRVSKWATWLQYHAWRNLEVTAYFTRDGNKWLKWLSVEDMANAALKDQGWKLDAEVIGHMLAAQGNRWELWHGNDTLWATRHRRQKPTGAASSSNTIKPNLQTRPKSKFMKRGMRPYIF